MDLVFILIYRANEPDAWPLFEVWEEDKLENAMAHYEKCPAIAAIEFL